MGDTSPALDNSWGLYLNRLAETRGWTKTQLAREIGVKRQTVHDWISNGGGDRVKIDTIIKVARAAGDHPVNTFMAAANLIEEEPQDREVGLIAQSSLPDEEKLRQIAIVQRKRDQDAERRIEDTHEILRGLSGKVA